jgi:hypothetical protein
VGKIYPEKTKEKDFLQHYVEHYNSIELNATHYKVYDAEAIKKWDHSKYSEENLISHANDFSKLIFSQKIQNFVNDVTSDLDHNENSN